MFFTSMTLPPRRSGTWMRISRLARDVLLLRLDQLVELGDTGLGLGLAGLGALPDPLELVLDRLLAARFLALLLLEALGLLLQIGRVIALVGEVFPAIELEDPVRRHCRGSSGRG